jgi:hypothetical protein
MPLKVGEPISVAVVSLAPSYGRVAILPPDAVNGFGVMTPGMALQMLHCML